MRFSGIPYPRLSGGHDMDAEALPGFFNMHIHTCLEMVYVIRGSVTFQVEGSVYVLHPGDLIITRMAEAHCLLRGADFPEYERMMFYLDPELLKETLNGRLLKPFLDRPLGVNNHYTAQELPGDMIQSCLQQLFHGPEKVTEMQALSYFLPVLQAIHDIWRKKRPVPDQEEPQPLAAQLVAYINRHLFDLEGLHQLEDAFYISASQINRVFRSFMGSSVWNYIKLKRLFAARELIQNGILPHKAAVTCGYQDYSNFFRAYKKQFGNTPQDDLAK